MRKAGKAFGPVTLAVALLALTSAVFANALLADFQFDDFQDIVDNRMATFEGLLAAPRPSAHS